MPKSWAEANKTPVRLELSYRFKLIIWLIINLRLSHKPSNYAEVVPFQAHGVIAMNALVSYVGYGADTHNDSERGKESCS